MNAAARIISAFDIAEQREPCRSRTWCSDARACPMKQRKTPSVAARLLAASLNEFPREAARDAIKSRHQPKNTPTGRFRSPAKAMMLLGLLMPAIILRVQIAARGGNRFVAQVIAHEAQINMLLDHMRSRRVS